MNASRGLDRVGSAAGDGAIRGKMVEGKRLSRPGSFGSQTSRSKGSGSMPKRGGRGGRRRSGGGTDDVSFSPYSPMMFNTSSSTARSTSTSHRSAPTQPSSAFRRTFAGRSPASASKLGPTLEECLVLPGERKSGFGQESTTPDTVPNGSGGRGGLPDFDGGRVLRNTSKGNGPDERTVGSETGSVSDAAVSSVYHSPRRRHSMNNMNSTVHSDDGSKRKAEAEPWESPVRCPKFLHAAELTGYSRSHDATAHHDPIDIAETFVVFGSDRSNKRSETLPGDTGATTDEKDTHSATAAIDWPATPSCKEERKIVVAPDSAAAQKAAEIVIASCAVAVAPPPAGVTVGRPDGEHREVGAVGRVVRNEEKEIVVAPDSAAAEKAADADGGEIVMAGCAFAGAPPPFASTGGEPDGEQRERGTVDHVARNNENDIVVAPDSAAADKAAEADGGETVMAGCAFAGAPPPVGATGGGPDGEDRELRAVDHAVRNDEGTIVVAPDSAAADKAAEADVGETVTAAFAGAPPPLGATDGEHRKVGVVDQVDSQDTNVIGLTPMTLHPVIVSKGQNIIGEVRGGSEIGEGVHVDVDAAHPEPAPDVSQASADRMTRTATVDRSQSSDGKETFPVANTSTCLEEERSVIVQDKFGGGGALDGDADTESRIPDADVAEDDCSTDFSVLKAVVPSERSPCSTIEKRIHVVDGDVSAAVEEQTEKASDRERAVVVLPDEGSNEHAVIADGGKAAHTDSSTSLTDDAQQPDIEASPMVRGSVSRVLEDGAAVADEQSRVGRAAAHEYGVKRVLLYSIGTNGGVDVGSMVEDTRALNTPGTSGLTAMDAPISTAEQVVATGEQPAQHISDDSTEEAAGEGSVSKVASEVIADASNATLDNARAPNSDETDASADETHVTLEERVTAARIPTIAGVLSVHQEEFTEEINDKRAIVEGERCALGGKGSKGTLADVSNSTATDCSVTPTYAELTRESVNSEATTSSKKGASLHDYEINALATGRKICAGQLMVDVEAEKRGSINGKSAENAANALKSSAANVARHPQDVMMEGRDGQPPVFLEEETTSVGQEFDAAESLGVPAPDADESSMGNKDCSASVSAGEERTVYEDGPEGIADVSRSVAVAAVAAVATMDARPQHLQDVDEITGAVSAKTGKETRACLTGGTFDTSFTGATAGEDANARQTVSVGAIRAGADGAHVLSGEDEKERTVFEPSIIIDDGRPPDTKETAESVCTVSPVMEEGAMRIMGEESAPATSNVMEGSAERATRAPSWWDVEASDLSSVMASARTEDLLAILEAAKREILTRDCRGSDDSVGNTERRRVGSAEAAVNSVGPSTAPGIVCLRSLVPNKYAGGGEASHAPAADDDEQSTTVAGGDDKSKSNRMLARSDGGNNGFYFAAPLASGSVQTERKVEHQTVARNQYAVAARLRDVALPSPCGTGACGSGGVASAPASPKFVDCSGAEEKQAEGVMRQEAPDTEMRKPNADFEESGCCNVM